jgi:transaldolase
MKIFLDTANIAEIKKGLAYGVIDGVTTNPSLVAKEQREFIPLIKEITAVIPGPVSVEVTASKPEEMIAQAELYAAIAANVVIKVPINLEGLQVVKVLAGRGIKTNVTLIFSPSQALLAAKAGATYISPFVGRLDDISVVGMDLVRQIVAIYENYNYATFVLAASLRSPTHFVDAALAGAHVCTLPPAVLRQLIKHPLTDIGLERFLADWKKVPTDR